MKSSGHWVLMKSARIDGSQDAHLKFQNEGNVSQWKQS